MSKPADEKDLVQAVLLADSFNSRFAPVARSLPRALFPLAGVPLIEYTLKALADAGVHECFVYCRAHANSLSDHLAKYSKQSKRFATPPIVRECPATVSSLGDAMRDLDQSRLVKNDFILASADLVTNANLTELLAEHKRRRAKDANCLLTLVMRSISGGQLSDLMQAEEGGGSVAVTNAETGCLRMLSPASKDKLGRFRLERAALLSCGRSRLWTSLVDLGLAVCSVHVPPRFTDEFDYRSLDDLVRGVLEHEEILGHTVSLHVLGGQEYACRVSNMSLYAVVTKHLLDNWVYPMTPGSMFGSQATIDYQVRQRNVYIFGRQTKVDRSARLEKSVLIDKSATVGSDCRLVNCVVGKNCTVGDGCRLTNCYLWPGAAVGSRCQISNSLLCNNCCVLDNSQLKDRCVLAAGVRVGPDAELSDCRLIVRTSADKDSSFDANQVKKLGQESNAIVYKSACKRSGDSIDKSKSELTKVPDSSSAVVQLDDMEREIWQAHSATNQDESIWSDSESSSDVGNEVPPAEVGEDHFKRELLDVLQRAEQDGHGVDTMVVEINSIKHAFCVHIDRLKAILVHTIMLYPLLRREKDEPDLSPAEYLREVKERLKAWQPLLNHYFNSSAESEALIFLRSFEDACCDRPQPLMKCALVLLRYFYDCELCEEPAILNWYAEESSHPSAGELRQSVSRMIQWLQEASEESDSD